MVELTHLGQYWSAQRREVRLLGCAGVRAGEDGRLAGAAFDLEESMPFPRWRRSFRAAHCGRNWAEVRSTYASLPFPTVELAELAEASGRGINDWALHFLNLAASKRAPVDLAVLDRAPDPGHDHLVAPVIPRRAQGFGVTYLNSALERESEGARSDYGYVYRAVRERGERPEIFLKGTAAEHFVGPRGRMGLRRDLTNSRNLKGEGSPRVAVAAGIEPELAAVVHANGEIWGYTLSNDVSGNRIENETLLYLAQAKHFTGALVLGPLIWLSREQNNPKVDLRARILDAAGRTLFEHASNSGRIGAPLAALIGWARSHVRLFPAEVFSTGTDCVPSGEVKVLEEGMEVEISSSAIGVLRHGAGIVPEEDDSGGRELNLDYSRLEFEGAQSRV